MAGRHEGIEGVVVKHLLVALVLTSSPFHAAVGPIGV